MSNIWYYADRERHVGPFTLQEIRGTLATLQNAKDVLVWSDAFADWKRAGDVPELEVGTTRPPPLPMKQPLGKQFGLSPKLKGIGGWLVLPVLGTILSPFYVAYDVLQDAAALAKPITSEALKNFVQLELAVSILLFVAWIVALIFAFQYRKAYPKLFVIITAVTFAFSCLDIYVSMIAFNIPFEPDDVKGIGRPLLTLLVWGPYMFLSKRVKNTFTR